jgi:hypothetical protein
LPSALKAAQGDDGGKAGGKLETLPSPARPSGFCERLPKAESSTGMRFPHFRRRLGALVNSGGHGNWKKIGPQKYAVTVHYFQLNPALNFDVQHSGHGRKVVETIEGQQGWADLYQRLLDEYFGFRDGTPFLTNPGATFGAAHHCRTASVVVTAPRRH